MKPSMEQDLSTLVARAQRGDETAFDAIYESFATPLYLYLTVRCDDPLLVEELASDLWVRVVEHLPAFRFRHPLSEAAFAAWLYRMAKNLLDDVHHRSTQEQVARGGTPSFAEMLLDDQVVVRKAKQRLRAAVDQLLPDQREVVLLRFIEKRRIADVALFMGWSEDAVKTVQYRALHALTSLLGGQRRDQK